MSQIRTVQSRHSAFRTVEGDGFDVQRAVPGDTYESVGPFIFLDHFGPIPFKPGESKGASSHPHAGIETLSLLLEGRMRHKDSMGNDSSMAPGDVQWMRAGRGVVHDEQPDTAAMTPGETTHGIQLWLNLPAASKHIPPAYRHVTAAEIPVIGGDAGLARARLVAGRIGDFIGPIETFGAPLALHASFDGFDTLSLPTPGVKQLAVYVMLGGARIAGQDVPPGTLAWLADGDRLEIAADAGTELMVIGGDPLDAPIVRYGPFVMNDRSQLNQAVQDFQAGRMGRIAA